LVLGKIGDEKAVPALCHILATDENAEVRRNAAEALGMIGSTAVAS
jgi:HEAT repeat protein